MTGPVVGALSFAMGIVRPVAARNPTEPRAFLEFVILGVILHAVVMAVFAQRPIQLVVDAGFIGLMGVAFLALDPGGIGTS